MAKVEREDIQIIARHSNWSKEKIEQTLKEQIYSDKAAWHKFLRLFFISLGVGFTTAGVIFFFAYNWANLHKFAKIGLVEGAIVILTLVVVFSKLRADTKNVLLTGAAILVGVLFAVFGQIYQTGANAYDFFLGWTLSIMIWVLISNFAPLWLVFVTLINTTLILYIQQTSHDWSEVLVFTLLFLTNVAFLSIALFGHKVRSEIKAPIWFSNLLALTAISFSTIGIVVGIFDKKEDMLPILLIIAALLYIGGIVYGLNLRRSFYLAIISFSVIIIISATLLKVSDAPGMFFLISLFVIGSVTFVIKNLIDLQKKWID